MAGIVPRKFYQQDTLQVAEDLLGCFLIREHEGKKWKAKITELEAYIGEDDLACHARVGRTKRTETMYGAAGHAYVYLIYGMYNCLNIVTEAKDYPAAILIRGVEIEGIAESETNGPGKLCRFLYIDRSCNGLDVTKGEGIWIEKGKKLPPEKIVKSKRIGVEYVKHCKEYLWRFELTKEK
jgi:DNA-3-methyladenine glycosylase